MGVEDVIRLVEPEPTNKKPYVEVGNVYQQRGSGRALFVVVSIYDERAICLTLDDAGTVKASGWYPVFYLARRAPVGYCPALAAAGPLEVLPYGEPR